MDSIITDIFKGQEIIDRTSINAWVDDNFRRAIEATGRKKIIVAGLWTEACVLFPSLDMLNMGMKYIFQQMPARCIKRSP